MVGLAALPQQPGTMLRGSCRIFTGLCHTWHSHLSVWQLWDPLWGAVRCEGAPKTLAGQPPGCLHGVGRAWGWC